MLITEISKVSREEIQLQTAKIQKKIIDIEIKDAQSAETAKIIEKECTSLEKLIETKRTDITGPINKQLDVINASAKLLTKPITEAKEDIRNKQIAYAQKLEAERLKKEADVLEIIRQVNGIVDEIDLELFADNVQNEDTRIELAIESRRQFFIEAERTRKFKLQQQEEQKKLDQIAKEQGAEAARIAKADAELRLRNQAASDEANRMIEDNKKREIEENAMNDQKRQEKSYASGGVKGLRKVTQFEIIDESLVPREFTSSDEKKIRAAVKEGTTEIPGVRIWTEDKIS